MMVMQKPSIGASAESTDWKLLLTNGMSKSLEKCEGLRKVKSFGVLAFRPITTLNTMDLTWL